MATTQNNSNLHAAKRNKQDEFYTQLPDIERELQHYTHHFEGKVVYLNCDDARWSNFYRYFEDRFHELALEKLVATHYVDPATGEKPLCVEYDGTRQDRYLIGDGDFRSEECVALLQEADIVVTNPPFSLFREYVAQLVEYEKKFLIIGPINAITYKEIFPLICDGQMWLGYHSGHMAFRVPDHYERRETRFWVDESGQKWRSLGNVCWFTNLDHSKRHEPLILYRTYNPADYPKYDNYDAINVDKVKDIPADYDGVMGVPITFLDKWNPDQFEILKFRKGDDGKNFRVGGKYPYSRILIKRR